MDIILRIYMVPQIDIFTIYMWVMVIEFISIIKLVWYCFNNYTFKIIYKIVFMKKN